MVKLEEIPADDGQSEKAQTSGGLPSADEDGALMDDLFDRAVAKGGLTDKTFEEALAGLSESPLFMNSLDVQNQEDNVALQALQALQYEGTKSEAAQNFKEQGNECVQAKQWSDAKVFYTKGIAVLEHKDETKWDKPEDEVEEQKLRRTLSEQLYANRARCNLELKNYRSTTLDCAKVLQLNPKNTKAHYRSASALFALDKVYEALDVCYRGLKIDEQNTAMQTLLTKIQTRSRVKEEQDRKRRTELLRQRQERDTLIAALKARKIKVRKTTKKDDHLGGPGDMADSKIRLSPDPLAADSTLDFPTMFLYPMHNQSDFVKAFGEADTIQDHLSVMFDLPWDNRKEYKVGTVECYMDTISGGMIKLGKKIPLGEILSNDKVEVLDGLVRIHVVPVNLSKNWIEEVKRKRGK